MYYPKIIEFLNIRSIHLNHLFKGKRKSNDKVKKKGLRIMKLCR